MGREWAGMGSTGANRTRHCCTGPPSERKRCPFRTPTHRWVAPPTDACKPWAVGCGRPVHTPSTAASRPFSPGGSNPASRPPSRPASRASGLWGEISDLVEENPPGGGWRVTGLTLCNWHQQGAYSPSGCCLGFGPGGGQPPPLPSQQGFLQALLRDVRLLVRDDHTRTQLARFCARLRSAHGTPCSPVCSSAFKPPPYVPLILGSMKEEPEGVETVTCECVCTRCARASVCACLYAF